MKKLVNYEKSRALVLSLVVVGVMLFGFLQSLCSVSAAGAQLLTASQAVASGGYYGGSQPLAMKFTPTVSGACATLYIKLGMTAADTGTGTIQIVEEGGDGNPTGSILWSQAFDIATITYNGTYSFFPSCSVSTLDSYFVVVSCTSEHLSVYSSGSLTGLTMYHNNGSWGTYPSWGFSYSLYVGMDTTVDTLKASAVNKKNQVKLGGLLTYLAANDYPIDCGIQFGFDNTYGNDIPCGKVTSTGKQYWYGILTNPAAGLEYHYRAYIRHSDGSLNYGQDETFTWGSGTGAIGNDFQMTALPPANITYTDADLGVIVTSMGVETDVKLYWAYSLDTTFTPSQPNKILLTSSLGSPDEVDFTTHALTANTHYYYRYYAVSNTGEGFYETSTNDFTTANPQTPHALNGFVTWLSAHGWAGQGIWWLVTLFAVVLTWFLLHHGAWKILAGVLTVCEVGAVLALGLIDWWLVIILAIPVALVIWKVGFGSGGED